VPLIGRRSELAEVARLLDLAEAGTDPAVSEAIIRWAAIAGMTRRISRGSPARRQPRYVCD